MAQVGAEAGLSCMVVLRAAARLLRQLVNWGEVTDGEAGRIGRGLSVDEWLALPDPEREQATRAASVIVTEIRDSTQLPIIHKGDRWLWTAGRVPIRCTRCGRILGFATEDHTLRVVIPTIARLEISSGVIRCVCGQERIWRPANPN